MKNLISKRSVRGLTPNARITRVIVAVALTGLFTTACDRKTVNEPAVLASIAVTPNPQTLAAGATQQFTAVGTDSRGATMAITPTWSIVSGGGTISATGLFTAGTTAGTYANTVRATSGAISGTATVTVTVPVLATIVVTPNPATLGIGGTQQFVAAGRDAAGNSVAITPVWSVVAGGGTIHATTGLFTAGTTVGAFANTVRATSGTISGTATVNVTGGALSTIVVTPNPANLVTGAAQQFTAVGRDASGNVVAITPAWTVASGGGTISSTGLFTAGTATGSFPNTVTATSGAISGTASVNVTAPAASLATITVTPNPASVLPNATQQFTAVGRDANGNVVAITPVWSVANGGGTINASTGVFTAGAATGTFANTVVATSGAIAGNATVTVPPAVAPLVSIAVSPNPDTTAAGGTQQFTAVGRDSNGGTVAVAVVWSVVNGGGTINATTGLFTAGPTGGTFTNTVEARSGTIAGTATVVVAPSPLTTITVTPNPDTTFTGQGQQFTAVGRDALGNVIAITPVWSVINGGGTINAVTGLFTAGGVAGTFTNTVEARSGTVAGTATVVLIAPPVVPPLINLGTAETHGIVAATAVTCAGTDTIAANVSVHPGLAVDATCFVTGVKNLGDGVAAQAQLDVDSAYVDLAGLPCPPANLVGITNIGGTTKQPGVYCSASSMLVTGDIILDGAGDPNAVFVFQAGSSLTTAGNVVLQNGAQAKNVYWLVGSSATVGTANLWKGNIIAMTSITLNTGVRLIGRALARDGGVTLGTGARIDLPPP
jgi:hypothetical protein